MTKRSNIILKEEQEDIEVIEGEIIDDNSESAIELKKETKIQPYTFLKTVGKLGSFILLAIEAVSLLKGFDQNEKGKGRRRKRRKNENISTGNRR